jgi:hypothetical protein
VGSAVAHAKNDIHFVGSVKTIHKLYPKVAIQEKLEGKPAGSYVVALATVDEVDIIAMGYKYNKRKVEDMCVK